jgi:hypothetical protein
MEWSANSTIQLSPHSLRLMEDAASSEQSSLPLFEPTRDRRPLHECIREILTLVILKIGCNNCTDLDGRHRIAKQVADHSDISGVRQLDERHEIRALVFQGGVRGMPYTLPYPESCIQTALPALRPSMYPLDISSQAFTWEPF